MTDFLVPDLGEGLEEATVVAWNVAVGDEVELNQTLCTLETAKAAVEIPSPYAGRIAELGGREDEVLAVGALLVSIDTVDNEPTDKPVEKPPLLNGAVRTPVLVGYGADDDFDVSRRTRPRAKPSVRRLAADLNVDLAMVKAEANGLIPRAGVLAAAGASTETPARSSHDSIQVRGVHAHMANRMSLSRSQIPDAHGSVQVDCTCLLALRDRLRASAADDAEHITAFVLTLRLVVIALNHHLIFNSTWVDAADGAQVHTHHGVHLGFGVAAPRGLLVPVVRDAQDKTTRELGAEVARLIGEARAGSLAPAELQGSTFTVSNFGALGLDEAVPIINYPEAAILGMGSIKPRAVVVDGAVTARPTMTLTCAFDHRIADGAQLAGFLGELRTLIEAPETALLSL